MNKDEIPILEGEPARPEEIRLMALFDEFRSKQFTFLDEAAKRIIELSTGLMALFLAVIAFGDDYPPAYLAGSMWTKSLLVAGVVALLAAIGAALVGVQPRLYPDHPYNVSEMSKTATRIQCHKLRWARAAGCCYGAGMLAFAALVCLLVLSA